MIFGINLLSHAVGVMIHLHATPVDFDPKLLSTASLKVLKYWKAGWNTK